MPTTANRAAVRLFDLVPAGSRWPLTKPFTPAPPAIAMNNGNLEPAPGGRMTGTTRASPAAPDPDELSRLKHELLQAEVRLAKARATIVSAEIDIKVINARLKVLTH